MILRILLVFMLLSHLSACVMGPRYLGYTVTERSFKVDEGKVIKAQMTRAGPLPVENEQYKIETAGVNVSLSKSSAENSELTWIFSFLSKNQRPLDYVKIEHVRENGSLELVVLDDSPVFKNSNWFGRSEASPMTRKAQPWIYTANDSTFIFKFTIKEKNSDAVVMYQPSLISRQAKKIYLDGINGHIPR